MLQLQRLRKDYGAATILSEITGIINDGEHVGLIGPNGAGKSTLLRIIIGAEQPDSGSVSLRPGAVVGYLAQAFEERLGATVGAAIAAAQADLSAAAAQAERAAEALATAGGAELEAALAAYEAAVAIFEAIGGYEREQRAEAVLGGLGLAQVAPETPVATLSGGQKTRLGLALLLLREPDLLLLDEPTNHLDVEALEWLEGFVQGYPRAALIVSHDRAFLDRTVTRILALDAESRTITSYAGNYSAYAAARAHERERQAAMWKDQQAYIGQVQADIARLRGRAAGLESQRTPRDNPDMKWILSGAQSAAESVARMARARERKLERYLESDERVDRPRQRWGLKLDFGAPPAGGRAVLSVAGLRFAYPGGSELFGGLSLEVQHGERIAIVGRNGAGKSTLLKLIAGRLAPDSGQVRLGASIKLGLLAQEHDLLDMGRSVLDHALAARPMSETEARSFLHLFLFGGDSVFQPVRACSLGERSRLQLAVLVLSGCNLLLLDEPLNHLDLNAREQFEEALENFAGTVIAVSHDRAFVAAFAERTVSV